mmetsp:Transcript_39884/g.71612  ORF Transcript_39884/g.71612 Transcript_39884/m.71612 type:complete len:129 (+) Transcript_39884:1001-1387(+)
MEVGWGGTLGSGEDAAANFAAGVAVGWRFGQNRPRACTGCGPQRAARATLAVPVSLSTPKADCRRKEQLESAPLDGAGPMLVMATQPRVGQGRAVLRNRERGSLLAGPAGSGREVVATLMTVRVLLCC